ncbi:hypothetical protein TYRP_023227 [Tyrophagus putrescentiae]|nr:hypothetical protein TYRP_023227 [Tyrophagus putrescentiae]
MVALIELFSTELATEEVYTCEAVLYGLQAIILWDYLQVLVKAVFTIFASKARLFKPTKRKLRDTRSQTIRTVVASIYGLFKCFELENRLNRAENLLLCNSHVVGDIGENRGLHKVAHISGLLSASLQLGTFLYALAN